MNEKAIIDLLTKQNDDLKDHFNTQVRALQEVHEVNHDNLFKEISEIKNTTNRTEALAKKTNGRVTRLEDEIYGEYDPKNKIIKGREGVLYYLNEVKRLRFTYKTWRHIAVTFLILCALFIKESREFIWQKLINFKI